MSQTDALTAAGFSPDEVNSYAAQQRSTLQQAGFSDDEINAHVGPERQPNMATGNRAFSRVLLESLGKIKDVAGTAAETVNAGVEAAANTIVGLATFPVSLVGAGLHTAQEWLNGNKDVDFEKSFGQMSSALNAPLYESSSSKGQDYTDAVGDMINRVIIPLGGHLSVHPAAPIPFVERMQMVQSMIRDELARKISGQILGPEDMKNVSQVIAAQDGRPDAAPHVENSLHETYDKTGIGPYTILQQAMKDAGLRDQLADPAVQVPKAFDEFVEKPSEPVAPGAGTLNAGINPTTVLKEIQGTASDIKDAVGGIVDSKIGREAVNSVMPMSSGSEIAQATAQHFANAMRNARFQWQRISGFLEKEFTPEERTAMWNAADEQNVLMMNGADTAGKGLETLPPKQQAVMNELHDLANGLWKRAQDAGMVEGEGLPFWTPRMAVLIGEDGEFMRPGEGKTTSSKGEGSNLKTSAPSLKQRKYLLAEDTEAAMKSSLGDNAQLVRDVLTMPLAMQRMGQAIAGREFVSQLKELGQVSGSDVVSEGVKPGFTTIDHPAFTTYRPEFVTNVEGKVVPRLDENGQPIMQRVPLLISDEWTGPLKAVLSTTDGAIYSALMLLKSKAMSAIMISPAAHNMVIFGRALAYDPAAVASLKAYFTGHALAKDPALMTRAISDGMVPIGANKGSMMDITDVARGLGREGGWGDPNQSWINLGVKKVASIFSETAANSIKARMDAFGDWWHHTLLWKQVGALQVYVYNDYYNHLIEKGHPPEVAGPIAANLANRYAGAVASENSSEWVRKALNVMLFSRSFNVGNVGAVHDAAYGLPSGLRSKMFVEAGEEAATKGVSAAAGKARAGLVTDLGMSMLMTALASAAVAKLLMHQTSDDIANGYGRRLSEMLGNIKDHPLNPGSYNPYRVLPTWDNEAGKQDRIDLGEQPGGQHEYLMLPTGKVVEDTVGWLLHAPDTFVKKLSPLARSAWESVTNDKGYGVPVEDPEGGMLKHIAQGLQHVIASNMNYDSMKLLWDVSTGSGTPLDKDKLAGIASGFSTSKGNPRGPEEGAYFAQQDRVTAMKKYQMDAVKEDLKNGREAEAFDRLKAIGLPPREIINTIRNIQNPRQGMTRQQMRRFLAEENDDDRAALESARRQ